MELTNEEALNLLKDTPVILNSKSKIETLEYSTVLGLAEKALEKQIPKKPIEDGYYDEPAVCPRCGGNVINMLDSDYHFQYCHYCGQALDWE